MSKQFGTEPRTRKANPGYDPNAPKSAASLADKPSRKGKSKGKAKAAPDPLAQLSVPVAPENQFAPAATDVVVNASDLVPVDVVLTKRITEKGGLTSYARPGVRASVYFSKGMFKDGVPSASITLIAEGLTEPGEKSTAADAAKALEKAAKAQSRALKAAERAEKAKAKADKATAAAAVATV